MRRKITVYGLRFSKTTFWNRINTGFLGPAVATVLTACGIETGWVSQDGRRCKLQQYLPLAVLKLNFHSTKLQKTFGCNSTYRLRYWNQQMKELLVSLCKVATVLTACGIETWNVIRHHLPLSIVATVLTACGIETFWAWLVQRDLRSHVATVLTACGIETFAFSYYF